MVFEPGEHEPDEYDPEVDVHDPEADVHDPEADLHDPEADLHDPSSDAIAIPDVSTGESDVPGDLLSAFWVLVLVVNAAVLAVSLGALFLVFEGDVRRGGALVGGGLVLAGFAVRRYRSFEMPAEPAEPDADDDRSPSSDEGGSDR